MQKELNETEFPKILIQTYSTDQIKCYCNFQLIYVYIGNLSEPLNN